MYDAMQRWMQAGKLFSRLQISKTKISYGNRMQKMFPHCKEGETMSVRKEIHGVTLSRERIQDRFGDMREHWVLKDRHGDIILAEKKWDDMLGELMWYSTAYFKGDAQ